MNILKKLGVAVVIFVVVALVTLLLGKLLIVTRIEFASSIGVFLEDSAGIIGFLAALVYFVFGSYPPKQPQV